MDKKSKENLYAICSYLEAFSPKITENIVDSFYQVQIGMNENGNKTQEEVLSDVKTNTESRVFSFLRNKPEEKVIGFAGRMQEYEKEALLEEAVKEVKQKSLLRKTLACLNNTDDLPLNEEEKITFLLSCLDELPPLHQQIDARLVLPIFNEDTGKKGTKSLPVRVVVANNQIVDIALDEERIKTR